ncbi:MAG: Gfo/Idh/MocA family protein [Planctomycetota bacterium]|jgi:predicted dehydrogenase
MAPGEGPCRAAIVGAGSISKLHFEGIARHPDRARVVALCDPDGRALEARAGEHGIRRAYTDLGEMVAGAGLDVAIVCTPTHVRADVVLPLVEAGIPVFCEKPFAETYAEAARMELASREAGVPVAVNQNFRRHFTFAVACEVLAGGELGRPLHLVQSVEHLRRDRGWRLERSRYVMAVMSIHWFDGYRFLLGDEPETVYCRGVNSPATEGGDDTAVSVVLEFRKGTVVSLSESFSSFARESVCSLDCESGGLVMDYRSLTEVRADGERIEHVNPFDKAEATWYLLDNLLKAAKESAEPETSAADNLKSMRVLEGAYRSMKEGRVVRVEEIG